MCGKSKIHPRTTPRAKGDLQVYSVGTRTATFSNYQPRTIPTNIYRGGYRSRGPEKGVLGGSWRYIAGELYKGGYRSRGPEKGVLGGSWRYIAGGLCRGGEAEEEEEEERRRRGEEEGRETPLEI